MSLFAARSGAALSGLIVVGAILATVSWLLFDVYAGMSEGEAETSGGLSVDAASAPRSNVERQKETIRRWKASLRGRPRQHVPERSVDSGVPDALSSVEAPIANDWEVDELHEAPDEADRRDAGFHDAGEVPALGFERFAQDVPFEHRVKAIRRRAARATKWLALSESQRVRFEAILIEQLSDQLEVWQTRDTYDSLAEWRRAAKIAAREIRHDTRRKFGEVLNPEQIAKYRRHARKARQQRRAHNRDGR